MDFDRTKDLSIGILCDYYGSLLTKKQQQAIELYYNDDMSLSEMAEQLHISRQGALENIHRGVEKLKEYEQHLHMVSMAQRREENFQALCTMIAELPLKKQDKIPLLATIEKMRNDR